MNLTNAAIAENQQEFHEYQAAIIGELDAKIKQEARQTRLQASFKAATSVGTAGDLTKGEAGQNLMKLMVLKADKVELDQVREVKANKVDLENMLELQNIVIKQFRQTVVLVVESINCITSQPNQSRLQVEKKIDGLLKQARLLTTWVFNVDPMKFMQSADA